MLYVTKKCFKLVIYISNNLFSCVQCLTNEGKSFTKVLSAQHTPQTMFFFYCFLVPLITKGVIINRKQTKITDFILIRSLETDEQV